MGRLGYLILLTLLVAGAAYVFWPEPAEQELPPLWRGAVPSAFRLVADGHTQEVAGERLTVDGIELPLDKTRRDDLWSYVSSLKVDAKLLTTVAEDALAPYGIDGTRELAGGNLRLRWGGTGDQRYVWDGATARLLPCSRGIGDRLDQLARRLDRPHLIDLPQVFGLHIDGLTLVLAERMWRDALQAERPDFNRRVNQMFDLIEGVQVRDLRNRTTPLAPPLHQIRLSPQKPGDPDHLLRLWRDGTGALVQLDTLPLQRLDAVELGRWNALLASFRQDYLFNLQTEFALRPLSEIRVEEEKKLRFRLEKHGLNDVANGRSQWDVVWPGGREAASENSAAAIAMAFDELVVTDARRLQAGEQPPANARIVTLLFRFNQTPITIAIAGNRVFSTTHVGVAVELPGLLKRLVPDDMLEPALTLRGAERVVKIQRQWHGGPAAGRSEIVAVSAGAGSAEGSWRQTWPKEAAGTPISVVAVDRLARAFCTARTQSVRLPTAADRAALGAPEFEIDVRFAQAQVRLSNDHTRLSDTTDQDLGFAFVREGDHWRAIDKESAISHEIDQELMDLLQEPLTDNLVLPLLVSLLTRVEIDGPAGRYLLMRIDDEAWQASLLDPAGRPQGEPHKADAVEVRRYLRTITGLRSLSIDADAGPIAPEQRTGAVLCQFPGTGDKMVRVVLTLGQTVDDKMTVAVDAGGMRGLPRGRAVVAAASRDALLPPLARFVATAK
jgi:hypothetical protein